MEIQMRQGFFFFKLIKSYFMFLKFRREGHSFSLKDWDFLSKRLKQLVNWQSMVTLASSK